MSIIYHFASDISSKIKGTVLFFQKNKGRKKIEPSPLFYFLNMMIHVLVRMDMYRALMPVFMDMHQVVVLQQFYIL
jgi:hypothetical protein